MPTCCTFYHGAGVKCPKHDKEVEPKKKYEFKPNPFVGKRTEIDKQCRCECHRLGHHFCIKCMNEHSASCSRQSIIRKGLRGLSGRTTQGPSFSTKYVNRY